MKFADATNLNRKSGAAKWRDLLFSSILQRAGWPIQAVFGLSGEVARNTIRKPIRGNDTCPQEPNLCMLPALRTHTFQHCGRIPSSIADALLPAC